VISVSLGGKMFPPEFAEATACRGKKLLEFRSEFILLVTYGPGGVNFPDSEFTFSTHCSNSRKSKNARAVMGVENLHTTIKKLGFIFMRCNNLHLEARN
jgi:hypothetical protein